MVSWQPCDFVTSGQGPCRSPCLLSAHRSICTEALLLAFAFTDLTSRTFADHLPSASSLLLNLCAPLPPLAFCVCVCGGAAHGSYCFFKSESERGHAKCRIKAGLSCLTEYQGCVGVVSRSPQAKLTLKKKNTRAYTHARFANTQSRRANIYDEMSRANRML